MTERFAQDRTFWNRMGRAVVVGFLGGVAALAFVRLVAFGTDLIWPEEIEYRFWAGSWWWAAVLGATGLIVGLMRVALRVPDDLSGSFANHQ
jgi:hypothetical protein